MNVSVTIGILGSVTLLFIGFVILYLTKELRKRVQRMPRVYLEQLEVGYQLVIRKLYLFKKIDGVVAQPLKNYKIDAQNKSSEITSGFVLVNDVTVRKTRPGTYMVKERNGLKFLSKIQ